MSSKTGIKANAAQKISINIGIGGSYSAISGHIMRTRRPVNSQKPYDLDLRCAGNTIEVTSWHVLMSQTAPVLASSTKKALIKVPYPLIMMSRPPITVIKSAKIIEILIPSFSR